MSNAGVPPLGWLTAILLSLVTLFVFGTLRDYGPDSVVRKFHLAATDRNPNLVAQYVTPDFDSASTQELWANVSWMLGQPSTTYEIQRVIRQPGKAAVVVSYQFSGGDKRALIWVVVRNRGVWQIDTTQTALAARTLTNAPVSGPFPVR